jgi:CRP/FNR family cyclic AMP-dependent transcriptional regulator
MLDLTNDLPRRTVAAGGRVLAEGAVTDELFVLLDGRLQIEKDGVAVATVSEPGICVGEVSVLLGIPATADVVATEPSTVVVIDDATRLVAEQPAVALELARMLAARLQRMTTYLVDLQHQYADHEGGLGMVDTVLGSLMHHAGTRSELRSERDPDPEY